MADGSEGGVDRVRTRLTRALQNYPVTIFTAAPYLVLIMPLAVVNRNPRTGFILALLGLAMVGAGTVETLLLPLWKFRSDKQRSHDAHTVKLEYRHSPMVARVTAVASMVADIVHAAAGGGTVSTQVTGEAAPSPLVNLTALVDSWKYVCLALLVASLRCGALSRASFYRWAGSLIVTQVIVASLTARTAPIIGYLTFAATVGLLFGIVRTRHVATTLVLLLVAWPTVFSIRNQIRQSNGVAVSGQFSAADRLRFDLQISRAADYRVPVEVGQPRFAEFVRYGLVPRILDTDRPLLSTGAKINVFLGGDTTSAYTFLPLGTIYFLEGPVGVVVYYASWALALVLLLRIRGGPGPLRLCLISLAIAGPLNWIATYPDSMVGYLQSIVSALPVLWAVRLSAWAVRFSGASAGSGRRAPEAELTSPSFAAHSVSGESQHEAHGLA